MSSGDTYGLGHTNRDGMMDRYDASRRTQELSHIRTRGETVKKSKTLGSKLIRILCVAVVVSGVYQDL